MAYPLHRSEPVPASPDLPALERGASLQIQEDAGAGGACLAAEQLALGQDEVNAGAADMFNGTDRARQLAFKRAHLVDILHHAGGAETGLFVEQLIAHRAAIWQARWEDAVRALGLPVHRLPSGAGHDAMKLHPVIPQAMLFVRGGRAGISHNPLETVTDDDAQLAVDAFRHLLENLA